MSDTALLDSRSDDFATDADSWRVFQICYVGSFTRSFGIMASAGVASYASQSLGISPLTLGYFLAGVVFTYAIAAILTIFAVKQFGFQRTMLLAAALQAASAVVVLASPALFSVAGSTPALGCLIVGAYLLAVGGGLNEATTVPLVAAHFPDNRLLGLHQLYTAPPAAFLFSTVVHQLASQSLLLQLTIYLLLVAGYGATLLWLPLTRPSSAQEEAGQTQPITALLTPLLAMLLLMLSLALFCESRMGGMAPHMIGEIEGFHTLVTYLFVAATTRLLVHWCLGYLRPIVTHLELLLIGSIFLLLGFITFANADSGPMLYKAVLLCAVGTAMLEPTLLALVADRYGQAGIASLGVLIGGSALVVALLATCIPSASVNATLEIYRQWWRYLAIAPALMIACYGSLIAYYGEGQGYSLLSRMRWPADSTLSTVLVWGAFGCVSAVITPAAATDLQAAIGKIILTYAYGYAFGPFWSIFWWISIPTMVLFGYVATVILFRLSDHTELARTAFSVIFAFALFTIWVESWMTVTGLIVNFVASYFKVSIFLFIDIAATVGWYLALRKVHRALDQI
ncbi:MFS transporter [Anatilimnocola sp. NA78]|uniref:MFS transporter n=1 Tax=Anatilimnocola sp. NA78 TaxID=3415683 RepID=UPI003CE4A3D8